MKIEDMIVELSNDPFNPELNFKCAVEYERLNQTASAVSFYLRTAEYGKGVLAYTSLLKMARCFEDQSGREHSVTNCILQALSIDSSIPDGWFMLSQWHERNGNWQEAYTFAQIGLDCAATNMVVLPANVGYLGEYCLEFEQAVSAWWIGRGDESQALLRKLYEEDIADEYKAAIKNNLERIGVTI